MGERLPPPDDLSDAEREEWDGITASLPADYFRPADVSLLAAFCQARAFYKQAAAQLKSEGIVMKGAPRFNRDGEVIGHDRDYPHPANAILTAQAAILATLAVKLRLCPSSRYTEKSAATKAKQVVVAKRPWE